MLRQRLYIDTSVIGGCCDDEFRQPSRRLIEEFGSGHSIAVISSITLDELERAPEEVRAVTESLPEEFVEHVELDEEAVRLADAYIADGVVGEG